MELLWIQTVYTVIMPAFYKKQHKETQLNTLLFAGYVCISTLLTCPFIVSIFKQANAIELSYAAFACVAMHYILHKQYESIKAKLNDELFMNMLYEIITSPLTSELIVGLLSNPVSQTESSMQTEASVKATVEKSEAEASVKATVEKSEAEASAKSVQSAAELTEVTAKTFTPIIPIVSKSTEKSAESSGIPTEHEGFSPMSKDLQDHLKAKQKDLKKFMFNLGNSGVHLDSSIDCDCGCVSDID